jgi:hypothetical protein
MGMAVTKFNSEALDQCRTTVKAQSSQFGSLGDGFKDPSVNAAMFGKLPSSNGLASAAGAANGTFGGELHGAESLLGKVERALDAVQSSVEGTERHNTTGLTAE